MNSGSGENQSGMLPEVFYRYAEADTIYLEVCVSQSIEPDKQMFEYQYVGLTFVLLLVLMLLWGLWRQVNG